MRSRRKVKKRILMHKKQNLTDTEIAMQLKVEQKEENNLRKRSLENFE
ncbi:hypothetical protein HY498_00845 [Candidatus Woesearchaeota archaeon]|nr:hypothetical protein [Candidatus Woesearchaeota archaeon]